MSLGPIVLDVAGTRLDAEDREILGHPAVGGAILFSRNYEAPDQLAELVAEIHASREPRLIVSVDHEGGRVQRFRRSFTALPAAAAYGRAFDADPARGLALARDGGWLMAAELRALGIDLSYAPVLDLGTGRSSVIGDRAFHSDPEVVGRLGRAFAAGMHEAGMAAVVKHFPGHGHVVEDSHQTTPVDERDLETLRLADLVPFERAVHGGVPAVMTAHVVYRAVDERPVGFSRVWLHDVLRSELGFTGAILSDDLTMAGAAVAGDIVARAEIALEAGCDAILVCNDREGATRVLDRVSAADPVRSSRLARLHGRGGTSQRVPLDPDRHRRARTALEGLITTPELDLGDDEPA